MNLVDLITRKDKNLLLTGQELEIARFAWQGSWRALKIPASNAAQLVLKNIYSHHVMHSYPADTGWYASVSGKSGSGKLIVSIECGEHKSAKTIELSAIPTPVSLDWPNNSKLSGDIRLTLHFILKDDEHANLLVHERLERSQILAHAKGRGVELGPGPNPQVLPSDTVQVEYVEEFPMDKWAASYDQKGKYGAKSADFSKYTIGTAWNLPQPDNSLDFIFSSHVVEHLANPIGHFVRWKKKLKPNGVILAVVPDMLGTKDYLATPSTIEELKGEFTTELTSPTREHYVRWAAMKNWSSKVDTFIAEGVSIHVHFYTPTSMALLLEQCVSEHGFKSYSIIKSRNHKDFYFMLKA